MDFAATRLGYLIQATDQPSNEHFQHAIARLAAGDGFAANPNDFQDSNRLSQPISFAIIDSHKFTRECISRLMSELFENNTIYEFQNTDELIASPPTDISIVIYHSHFSDRSDAKIQQLIAETKSAVGDIPLIWMSDVGEPHRAQSIRIALGSGARGYIPTQTAGVEIVFAVIRFVEAGGSFAPIEAEPPTNHTAIEPAKAPMTVNAAITSRQMDVLALITEGKANKIIAHQLGMSESTVKAHVRNIIRMMGVRNRTQVACNAQAWIAAQNLQKGDD